MESLIWKTIYGSGYKQYWLSLPGREVLLYLREIKTPMWLELDKEICTIELVATENASARKLFENSYRIKPKRKQGARVLALLRPHVSRKPICPQSVTALERGFKEYLEEWISIDTGSPIVRKTANAILKNMPEDKKENLYWRAVAAFEWVRKNISYTILPKERMRQITNVIMSLPDDLKNDPFTILRKSYPRLKRSDLRKTADQIHLSTRTVQAHKRAEELMREASRIWHIFQEEWVVDSVCSASRTIKDRAGKCVGIANTFIAIARILGIPAKYASGYVDFGFEYGPHAWAHIFIPPYGWREVDPTARVELDSFLYGQYGYEFIKYNPSCEAILVPDIDYVSREIIEEAKELSSRKRSFLARRFEKKQVKATAVKILEEASSGLVSM